MAEGFEADPEQLEGLAARFGQASQQLDDIGRLAWLAAAIDLQGTPAGPAFARTWEEIARGYLAASQGAAAMSDRLIKTATNYRETEQATTARLDGLGSKLS